MSAPEVPGVRRGRALGTDLVIATTDPSVLDAASGLVMADLDAIDAACSRFRRDSEIWALEAAGGHPVGVSALLYEVVACALAVAEQTGGAVDPTVGNALVALGYDRDFADLDQRGDASALRPSPAIGWWSVEIDAVRSTVCVPGGVILDLGATAKAFAADRSSARAALSLGCGVLVSLGGDVAVSGPPPDQGWPIGIALRSSDGTDELRQCISVSSGAIASSSPSVRSWRRAGKEMHHIVDPLTGEPAPQYWRLASVAGTSCVQANAFSTASIVWGATAIERLVAHNMAARLEPSDGPVVLLGGWPPDPPGKAVAELPSRPRDGTTEER